MPRPIDSLAADGTLSTEQLGAVESARKILPYCTQFKDSLRRDDVPALEKLEDHVNGLYQELPEADAKRTGEFHLKSLKDDGVEWINSTVKAFDRARRVLPEYPGPINYVNMEAIISGFAPLVETGIAGRETQMGKSHADSARASQQPQAERGI